MPSCQSSMDHIIPQSLSPTLPSAKTVMDTGLSALLLWPPTQPHHSLFLLQTRSFLHVKEKISAFALADAMPNALTYLLLTSLLFGYNPNSLLSILTGSDFHGCGALASTILPRPLRSTKMEIKRCGQNNLSTIEISMPSSV